jgi:hypothetical protein
MSIADPNKTILTGENTFIRLSPKDGDPNSTDASYWRIIFSPAGSGHVLHLKSELTEGRWRIYSDNIAMARWLQSTVQGMLNAELSDTTIPCAEAAFSKAGDPRYFWTEYIKSYSEDISLTWFDIGAPLLIHSQPNAAAAIVQAQGGGCLDVGRGDLRQGSPGAVEREAARG